MTYFPMSAVWRTQSALLVPLLMLLPIPSPAAPTATFTPSGRWIWDTGEAALEFHPCGAALCGRIIGLRDESSVGPSPMLDSQNPDLSLRGRRICGLDYITGLKPTLDGGWVGGRIYDFLHGGSYDLDLTVIRSDHIDMRGYQGIRLLGTTLHLLPAPADLHTCVDDALGMTKERTR
jgi:uncharacterized protein (DUF2147 family)